MNCIGVVPSVRGLDAHHFSRPRQGAAGLYFVNRWTIFYIRWQKTARQV